MLYSMHIFERWTTQVCFLWSQGQIQEQLVQQKAKESEVNIFIKECKMMEERISQDIHALKERWEKYGYQAQKDTQKLASKYRMLILMLLKM